MIANEMDMDAQHLCQTSMFLWWKGEKMQEFCHFNRKCLSSDVAKAITSDNDGKQIRRFNQYREIIEQFQQNTEGHRENWKEVFTCRMDNRHGYNKF